MAYNNGNSNNSSSTTTSIANSKCTFSYSNNSVPLEDINDTLNHIDSKIVFDARSLSGREHAGLKFLLDDLIEAYDKAKTQEKGATYEIISAIANHKNFGALKEYYSFLCLKKNSNIKFSFKLNNQFQRLGQILELCNEILEQCKCNQTKHDFEIDVPKNTSPGKCAIC